MWWSDRWAHVRVVPHLLVLVLAGGLAACGFQLRGAANFPFNSVYVSAPSSPPLALELTRAMAGSSSTKVAESPATAEVLLDIPSVVDDKEVLSLTSGGAVREYQLVKRVAFRLHDKDGNDWMPPGEIVVRRAYTFNESQVLARDLQEQRLRRDMDVDVAAQLLRRLQAAQRPA
jgi:LPS-assembly lipoprotein